MHTIKCAIVLFGFMGALSLSGHCSFSMRASAQEELSNGEPHESAAQRVSSRLNLGIDGDVNAVVVQVRGPIDYSMSRFLKRSLASIEDSETNVVILDIESPGGMLDATFEMLDLIERTEHLEFVAFIRHSAYSGAAMLALGCHQIVVHPDAQFGDVGVIVGGPFSPFQYVDEKQRSPVVTRMRTIAEAHQRPAALAEAMVDKDTTVYRATRRDDGKVTFFTEKEWEALENPDAWEKGPPVFESRDGKFLTVSGARAVELGLANQTQRSLDGLLENLQVQRPVKVLAWTWVDGLLDWLNSRWITWILLFLGFFALLFELSSPGLGIGGLASALCFSIFFWSRFLGGTAGWLEVILFLMGLVFIAAEFFVIPGFGVAGVSGTGLLIVSLVMASRRVVIPQSNAEWTDLGFNVIMVLSVFVAVMMTAFYFADRMSNFPLFRRLVLQPPAYEPVSLATVEGKKSETVLAWQRLGVGDLGYTVSPLRPSGKAQFADEIVDVATEGEFVAPETPIRILRKVGNRVIVREA